MLKTIKDNVITVYLNITNKDDVIYERFCILEPYGFIYKGLYNSVTINFFCITTNGELSLMDFGPGRQLHYNAQSFNLGTYLIA